MKLGRCKHRPCPSARMGWGKESMICLGGGADAARQKEGESRPHAYHALENERAAPLVFSIKQSKARP